VTIGCDNALRMEQRLLGGSGGAVDAAVAATELEGDADMRLSVRSCSGCR